MNKKLVLPVRIYYEDTDAGGIVYYANYLKYAERARTEYIRALGFGQVEDLESAEKFAFVVRHVEIDYLKPSKLDDLVEITCEAIEAKGATIEVKQEVVCNGEVRVKMKVTAVYLSLSKMRPVRVPEAMIKAMMEDGE